MIHFKTHPIRRPGAWLLAGAALALTALTACDGGGNGPDKGAEICPDSYVAGQYDSLHVPLCVMLDTGATLYTQAECSRCHGSDGAGYAGVTPPHANSDFFMNNKRETIVIALGGHNDSLLVNGLWYQGTMPNFDYLLSDAELASILTYIRVELNDSTVTNCNANQLDANGFATCTKTARTVEDRKADTVAAWEVKAVRDSMGAASP